MKRSYWLQLQKANAAFFIRNGISPSLSFVVLCRSPSFLLFKEP